MSNMDYYSAARVVPDNAVKPISGGTYGSAGLSDINTQWRIERMTEIFGPIGVGWAWEPVELRTENGVCYAHITLRYKTGDGWSEPIHGYGGTKVSGRDDSDLVKSTITDALGNAMRYVGIGADVWYKPQHRREQNRFDSKYSQPDPDPQPGSQQEPKPKPGSQSGSQPEPQPQPPSDRPRQMAQVQQIQYICEHADSATYDSARRAFGPNLEQMTYMQAEKLIARIDRRGGGR